MAREVTRHIYNSTKWRGTKKIRGVRKAYLDSRNWACERCDMPANIVHHIIYLTAENVHNLELCYGWDNLEAVCNDCHADEHSVSGSYVASDVRIDGDEVVAKQNGGQCDAMSRVMAGVIVK